MPWLIEDLLVRIIERIANLLAIHYAIIFPVNWIVKNKQFFSFPNRKKRANLLPKVSCGFRRKVKFRI